MQDPFRAIQAPLLLQILDDLRVRVLDEESAVARLTLEEAAVETHHVTDRDTLALAELEVGNAICRSGMHDPGALFHAHQLRRVEHDERESVGKHVGEERLVGQVDEIAAVHLTDDFVVAFEDRQAFLGEDVRLIPLRDADVGLAGVHGQRDVARERPRGGGPRQQERLAVRVVEPEFHVHGRVRRVLAVSLAQLVRRERCLAARAVRRDLVALVEHLVVPELFQAPPHRLDVCAVVRAIRMVEIEPEAEALAHLAPLVDVLVHRRLAARVELRDAVFLDLFLAADLQRALHLELDREPVGVPTGLSRHGETGHLLVAREDVLVRAGEDVMQTRQPVGSGRSLVEHVRRRVATHLEAALEDVGALPELEDLDLRLGKSRACADG